MVKSRELIEGVVLDRVETGERFVRITLFSLNAGLLSVLHRVSKSNKTRPTPDIFDDVEFSLDYRSVNKNIPFVKDFQILNKRTEIAKSHTCFNFASKFASLILNNGLHMQDFVQLYNLMTSSLEAFQRAERPDIVWFKTIFLFGRIEGLAVEQDWMANLEKTKRKYAADVLSNPIKKQNPSFELLNYLINSLSFWLQSETEIIC